MCEMGEYIGCGISLPLISNAGSACANREDFRRSLAMCLCLSKQLLYPLIAVRYTCTYASHSHKYGEVPVIGVLTQMNLYCKARLEHSAKIPVTTVAVA